MSEKFQNKYRNETTRLQGWDYSQEGGYYITICAKYRDLLFGICKNGKMELSGPGKIVNDLWYKIPERHPMVVLDEFVVMPNHIHGIFFIDYGGDGNGVGTCHGEYGVGTCHGMSQHDTPTSAAKFGKPIKNSVSMIINHYKGYVTKNVRQVYSGFEWQSRFHDHIIRDDYELNRIRKYIIENPEKWNTDKNFTS